MSDQAPEILLAHHLNVFPNSPFAISVKSKFIFSNIFKI